MDSTDLQDTADCAQSDHDSLTESPKFSSLTMEAEVVKKWRRVGVTEGLKTDSEIVLFLINQYENTHGAVHPPTQCPHCRSSLHIVCSACGWSVAVSDCRNNAEPSSVGNSTRNVENCHRLTDVSGTYDKTFSSEGVRAECSEAVVSDKTVFSESVIRKQHLCLEMVITDETVCSETDENVCSEVEPDEDLSSEAKSSHETRTRVNPLVLTPPSAQLRRGWCEHKRVKIEEAQSSDEQTSLQTSSVNSLRPSESNNPFSPLTPSTQFSGGCSGAKCLKTEKPVSDTHGLSQVCAVGSLPKNISDSEHIGNGDSSENPNMETKTKKKARFVYQITLPLPSEDREMRGKTNKKIGISGCTGQDAMLGHSQPSVLSSPQFPTETVCWKTSSVVKSLSEPRSLSDNSEIVGQKVTSVVKGLKTGGGKRKGSVLKCGICRESFSATTLLQQHITQTHMKGGLYQCPHCSKTFVHKQYLENFHLSKHVSEAKVAEYYKLDGVCNQCGKYRKNLSRHLEVHTQDRKHRCHVCGASFKTKDCLRQHVQSHSVEKRYKCKLCGKRFKTQVSLCGHVALHRMKEADWKHTCPICDSRQLTKSKLAIHMRKHTGDRPFVCDVCAKRFTSAYSLKLHIRCCHSSERPFVCQECGQAFAIPRALKAHVHVRHQKLTKKLEDSRTEGVTVLQFLCQLCGLAFRQKNILADHLQSHANERTFKCDRCDKAFNTQGCLRQHRLQVHIGREKPYKCSQCGHGLLSPGELKTHMRSHTGEKPFTCSVCSKSFASKTYLGKHMKIHNGRRPFMCEVCGSSFQRQYRLTEHMRKHTGQKPYQCIHCGEAFAWDSGLRWHYRKNTACANTASK